MPENQTSVNQKRNLSVLITGGGGLIGKHLTSILTEAGYNVSHLSRNIKKTGDIRAFIWDAEKMFYVNKNMQLSAVFGDNFKLCNINHFNSLAKDAYNSLFLEIR